MKKSPTRSLFSFGTLALSALIPSLALAEPMEKCSITINGTTSLVDIQRGNFGACKTSFESAWASHCSSNKNAEVTYAFGMQSRGREANNAGSGNGLCIDGAPSAQPVAPPPPQQGPGQFGGRGGPDGQRGGGQQPGQQPGQPGQPGQQPGPQPQPRTCEPRRGIDERVRLRSEEAGTCLVGFDRWDGGSRDGWERDNRRSDGRFVDVDVTPDCNDFRACVFSDSNPGSQPSDAGSTHTRISDSQASFSAAGGQSAQVRLLNPSALITTAYQLVNQPQIRCIRAGQDRPVVVRAVGFGREIETTRDCQTVERQIRLDRVMPGFVVDTLTPQTWMENDFSEARDTYTTDVTINMLPIDFPGTYTVNGSVSLTQGQQAQLFAQSKYFTHEGQVASQSQNGLTGTQVINVVSKLRPIAAPNGVSVDYDGQGKLTIIDSDNSELSQIDPNGQVTYNIAAYVNWNKTFGHEKFGNVLTGRPEAVVRNAKETRVQVDLKAALEANNGYKTQLKGGGKDWAIYLEVTTSRSNKYVTSDPTSTKVYEITVGKHFVMKPDAIKLWTDGTDKYR